MWGCDAQSTLIKLLTGELEPEVRAQTFHVLSMSSHANRPCTARACTCGLPTNCLCDKQLQCPAAVVALLY